MESRRFSLTHLFFISYKKRMKAPLRRESKAASTSISKGCRP